VQCARDDLVGHQRDVRRSVGRRFHGGTLPERDPVAHHAPVGPADDLFHDHVATLRARRRDGAGGSGEPVEPLGRQELGHSGGW